MCCVTRGMGSHCVTVPLVHVLTNSAGYVAWCRGMYSIWNYNSQQNIHAINIKYNIQRQRHVCVCMSLY